MVKSGKANRLINATSPYLLQHAYNPVDWYEWGKEALEKAKAEDKPLLVSIGYSSCHWCHVMERECFEKADVAKVMNDYFVCIKVDREERPDIDQIYMEAVQALGINGGWPLNVFLTHDQKPFYGGTYFPPQNWVQVLTNIHQAYQTRRSEIENSAEELKQHLSQNDIDRFRKQEEASQLDSDLEIIYKKLEQRFDVTWGGLDKAPKFIMPSIWLWLLRYYHISKNSKALEQIILTLERISMGGIYDQVGGGFARYAVDGKWFAPHFEKMLYDNAQLMSLYAEAFAVTKNEKFRIILNETFEWIEREMTNEGGGFFSALDADSEGEEGKFYVWQKEEFFNILKSQASIIADYYNVTDAGNWEHGNNILFQTKQDHAFLKENSLDHDTWQQQLREAKEKLLAVRDKRIRPGLDDKVITSWNAMMVCGLIDTYKALGDEKFLHSSIKNMRFLETELTDGRILFRSHRGKRSSIKGFLDDYAYFIQANLKLYGATFDEHWIDQAANFMEESLRQFFDPTENYFHYTGLESEKLIASRKEIFDNVIPSSNSVMAQNLFRLGTALDREEWKIMARNMTMPLGNLILAEPNYMSNWAIALAEIKKGLADVVISGKQLEPVKKEFLAHYQPFINVMGTHGKSNLPLLQDKKASDETTIYVCYDKSCKLPVHTVEEALTQL
jgi:uncharacterized protein YyaL (SSP411 family)